MGKNIAIAGAGTMGSSMAQIFAKCGYEVWLYDIAEASVERSKKIIKNGIENEIDAGSITKEQGEQMVNSIHYSLKYEDVFPQADYVIESIMEKIEIKHAFWEKVSNMVSEDAILATNTSGLSITKISEAVHKPERFCGMHWFNPPHLTPLVEIISGEKTSDTTVTDIYNLAIKIGRKPIKVYKDPSGFCVNRIQFAVFREALNIVEKGYASMEDVDNALRYGLGMRYAAIGIFQMADLGGLDVWSTISSYLWEDLSDAKTLPKMLEDLIEQRDYGVKSGRGFYDYSGGRDDKVVAHRDRLLSAISEVLAKFEEDK